MAAKTAKKMRLLDIESGLFGLFRYNSIINFDTVYYSSPENIIKQWEQDVNKIPAAVRGAVSKMAENLVGEEKGKRKPVSRDRLRKLQVGLSHFRGGERSGPGAGLSCAVRLPVPDCP